MKAFVELPCVQSLEQKSNRQVPLPLGTKGLIASRGTVGLKKLTATSCTQRASPAQCLRASKRPASNSSWLGVSAQPMSHGLQRSHPSRCLVDWRADSPRQFMLKTAFAAGFSNIAVADISRPLWSGLRSASSPAFTHTNSIMADSMIGKRFDFLLRDETRLEGTLEGVNQDDRQLTISNGAALGVAPGAALQLLIEFAGSSTRTWKTQHVQICSRLHGAHTGQTFWSWH